MLSRTLIPAFALLTAGATQRFAKPANDARSKPQAAARASKASEPVFVLHDNGGEHIATNCERRKQRPKSLKRKKTVAKFPGYLGSVQTADGSNEAGIEAWEHFFSSNEQCSAALKTYDPSAGD